MRNAKDAAWKFLTAPEAPPVPEIRAAGIGGFIPKDDPRGFAPS